MAIFEQIGKRLTDMGQGVAQQTKNFADVAKLNTSISEKERKVVQLYTALGQAYYERHKDDPDAEEQQIIGEINALHAEIWGHQEEIQNIKKISKCPNCGTTVSEEAIFCNSCGTRLK